jgi:hypothetical protein
MLAVVLTERPIFESMLADTVTQDTQAVHQRYVRRQYLRSGPVSLGQTQPECVFIFSVMLAMPSSRLFRDVIFANFNLASLFHPCLRFAQSFGLSGQVAVHPLACSLSGGIVLFQWRILSTGRYSLDQPPSSTLFANPIPNWTAVPQTFANNTLVESVRACSAKFGFSRSPSNLSPLPSKKCCQLKRSIF